MNKKGMTLIELIAVIAIIAILSLMVAPNLIGIRKRGIRSTLNNKITRIENAAIKYAADNIIRIPSPKNHRNLDYMSYPVYNPNDNKYYHSCDDNYENCQEEDVCMSEKSSSAQYNSMVTCLDYCLVVYVSALIQSGYLTGDNEAKDAIIHPLNGVSLNNQKVCLRYDTSLTQPTPEQARLRIPARKIVAYILDEGDLYDDFE